MRIWLIRHGATELSEARRYQGCLDTPLSADGRQALRRADFCPETVYVSPLLRCRETASILFPDAVQIPVPGLAEMHFGVFEGRSAEEMREDAAYRAWVDSGCTGPCPGGEDKACFSQRIYRAFSALTKAAIARQDPALVLVAHGGTQMAVLERWGWPARAYYEWCTAPGAGYELQAETWPERLKVMQEISFLK